MPNFDYAIVVGVCTLVVLVCLRVAIPLMRSAARRRTDEMLLRVTKAQDEEKQRNKTPSSDVARMSEGPKKTETDR